MKRNESFVHKIKETSRLLTGLTACASILVSSVSSSFAQSIIIDPSAPINTIILPTISTNGIPVINIATPISGVSLNQFEDYNVGATGLILNNSTVGGVTQLGANITANGNLVSGPANVIVNEVTSAATSTLNGTTEVFGQTAAVIIANPNGITCDGCAFLNTSSTTLTTGQVSIAAGAIDITVSTGQIIIGTNGFTTEQDGALIARNITSVGSIVSGTQAGDTLLLSGGSQNVNLNTVNIGASNIVAAPVLNAQTSPFAIDTSASATITTGNLIVESNETGLGVNLYGAIDAQTISADASGDLFYGDVVSSGDVSITANAIRQYGDLQSNGTVTLTGDSFTLYNGRTISTSGDVRLVANDYLVIAGEVSAQNINVEVITGSLTNSGFLLASGDLMIIAGENVTQQREIATEYDTSYDPALQSYVDAYQAQLLQGGSVADIAAGMLARASVHEVLDEYITAGATMTGTNVVVSVGTDFTNTGGAIAATNDVVIQAGQDIVNNYLATIHLLTAADGCAASNCGYRTDFNAGEILAGNTITMLAERDIVSVGSVIAAANDITLNATNDLSLSMGVSHFEVTAGDPQTVFASSIISSLYGKVAASAGHNINSIGSKVSAATDIILNAGNEIILASLSDNLSGTITTSGTSNVYSDIVSNWVVPVGYTSSGSIASSNSVVVGSTDLTANRVYVSAANDITTAGLRIMAQSDLLLVSELGSVYIDSAYLPDGVELEGGVIDLVRLRPELTAQIFGSHQFTSVEAVEIQNAVLATLQSSNVYVDAQTLIIPDATSQFVNAIAATALESFDPASSTDFAVDLLALMDTEANRLAFQDFLLSNYQALLSGQAGPAINGVDLDAAIAAISSGDPEAIAKIDSIWSSLLVGITSLNSNIAAGLTAPIITPTNAQKVADGRNFMRAAAEVFQKYLDEGISAADLRVLQSSQAFKEEVALAAINATSQALGGIDIIDGTGDFSTLLQKVANTSASGSENVSAFGFYNNFDFFISQLGNFYSYNYGSTDWPTVDAILAYSFGETSALAGANGVGSFNSMNSLLTAKTIVEFNSESRIQWVSRSIYARQIIDIFSGGDYTSISNDLTVQTNAADLVDLMALDTVAEAITQRETEIADNSAAYLRLLADNPYLTAVEALRRATSGADIKDAARNVGVQSSVSLINQASIASRFESSQAAIDSAFNSVFSGIVTHNLAVSSYNQTAKAELASLTSLIDLGDPALATLAQSEVDVRSTIFATEQASIQSTYQGQLAANQTQYLLELSRVRGWFRGYKRRKALNRKRAADANALASYNTSLLTAQTQYDIDVALIQTSYSSPTLNAQVSDLNASYATQMTTYGTIKATLDQNLQATITDALRIAETLQEEQLAIEATAAQMLAAGSVTAGESSLAASLTNQNFATLNPNLESVFVNAQGIVTASISTDNLPVQQALISSSAAEQDTFIAATTWRFASNDSLNSMLVSPRSLSFSGGDLNVSAAQDVYLLGVSMLSAQDDLRIEAGGRIGILGAVNSEFRPSTQSSAAFLEIGETLQLGTLMIDGYVASSSQLAGTDAANSLTYAAQTSNYTLANAVMTSGGNLTLSAGADIINFGGSIAAGENLIATAITGDIRNEALRQNFTLNSSNGCVALACGMEGHEYRGAEMLAGAGIILASAGNIENVGSVISAAGSILIDAEGDFTNKVLSSQYLYHYVYSSSFFGLIRKVEKLNHAVIAEASVSTLYGDINVSAQNISMAGAEISAGGDVILDAVNDITFTAISEELANYRKKRGFKFLSYNVDNVWWNEFSTAYSQVAGNNIYANAGNNITATGGLLFASNDIDLIAGADITFDALQNDKYEIRKGWSFGISFGGSGVLQAIAEGDNVLEAYMATNPALAGVYQLATANDKWDTINGILNAGYNLPAFGAGVASEFGKVGTVTSIADALVIKLNPFGWMSDNAVFKPGKFPKPDLQDFLSGISFRLSAYSSQSQWTESYVSQIVSGNDLWLDAGSDLSLVGGTVASAGNNAMLYAGDNVLLAALSDSSRTSSSSWGLTLGISATNGNTFGVDFNTSNSTSAMYSNASLTAGGDIDIISGLDTTLLGANIAANGIYMDVGQDLIIQSRQNTSDSSSFGFNFSVPIGGAGAPSFGVQVGAGFREYTDTPTTIVAQDRLSIYTGRGTYILGAGVWSETGNMLLDTGTLSFDNFNDVDKNYAVSVNLTFSLDPGAVTDASGSLTYKDVQALTYATVGAGEIIVRDAVEGYNLDDLNRDPANMQEITRDVNFRLEIPGVNLKQWQQNVEASMNLLQAATTRIPDSVKAQGGIAIDAYRDLILSGLTQQEAIQYVASQEFQFTLGVNIELAEAVSVFGSFDNIPQDVLDAIYLGNAIEYIENSNGELAANLVVPCNTSGTKCLLAVLELKNILSDPEIRAKFHEFVDGAIEGFGFLRVKLIDRNGYYSSATGHARRVLANLMRTLMWCAKNDPEYFAAAIALDPFVKKYMAEYAFGGEAQLEDFLTDIANTNYSAELASIAFETFSSQMAQNVEAQIQSAEEWKAWIIENDQEYRIINRTLGILQAAGGLSEMVGGSVIAGGCSVGTAGVGTVACTVGGSIIVINGIDNLSTGISIVIYGENQLLATSQLIAELGAAIGLPPEAINILVGANELGVPALAALGLVKVGGRYISKADPSFELLVDNPTVDGIWDQQQFTPIQRGNAIEDYLAGTDYSGWTRVGSQNNGFSPAWDFNQGSTWASLKTVDTGGSGWLTRMRSHIRELQTWGSPTNPNAVKVLDLRVQPGGAASAQSLVDYGASRGVQVIINEF